jgi:hypothetical protein
MPFQKRHLNPRLLRWVLFGKKEKGYIKRDPFTLQKSPCLQHQSPLAFPFPSPPLACMVFEELFIHKILRYFEFLFFELWYG